MSPAPTIEDVIEALRTLTETDRMTVFSQFCTECGSYTPGAPCSCWYSK